MSIGFANLLTDINILRSMQNPSERGTRRCMLDVCAHGVDPRCPRTRVGLGLASVPVFLLLGRFRFEKRKRVVKNFFFCQQDCFFTGKHLVVSIGNAHEFVVDDRGNQASPR